MLTDLPYLTIAEKLDCKEQCTSVVNDVIVANSVVNKIY